MKLVYIVNSGSREEFKKDIEHYYSKRITCRGPSIEIANRLGEEIKKKYELNDEELSHNFKRRMEIICYNLNPNWREDGFA